MDPAKPILSATAVDLISQSAYDDFGRETYKYLPFPSTAIDGTQITGNFKTNPFQQLASFYSNIYANNPLKGQGKNYFYSQTDIEFSALNRVEKTMAPGNNCVGASRGPNTNYWVNTAIDSVRIWNVTIGSPGSFSTYASPGRYAAGLLIKNVSVDENGKQVVEFKDNEDKAILKKVQPTALADGSTGSGPTGWLCTYYLYD